MNISWIYLCFLTYFLAFTLGCSYVNTRHVSNMVINKIKIDGDEYHIKTSDAFIRIKIKDTTIFETYYATNDDVLQCEIFRDGFGTSISSINGKYVLLLQPETINKLKDKND